MNEDTSEMMRLVDRGDLDGLLEIVTPDDIAIAWHRYRSPSRPVDEDPPDWWAIEVFMTRTIFERPDLHRLLLLKLIEHAPADRLGQVGAGPLENFVSDNEDDLAWLESRCRTNPGLRTALANVWCAGDVTEATLARLDAAAGSRLSRPSLR